MKVLLNKSSLLFLLSLMLIASFSVAEIDVANAGTLPSGMMWFELGDDPKCDEKTVFWGYDDIYNNTEAGGTCSSEIANNQTWLFFKLHIRELKCVGTRSYFMYLDNRSDNTGDTLRKWDATYTFEYALSVRYVSHCGGIWSTHFWKFNGWAWVEQIFALTDGYYYEEDGDDYVWAGVRLSDIGYLFEGTGDFCIVFTTESTYGPNRGDAKDHDPDKPYGAYCVEHEVISEQWWLSLVIGVPILIGATVFIGKNKHSNTLSENPILRKIFKKRKKQKRLKTRHYHEH
jgi:hypothetical protein